MGPWSDEGAKLNLILFVSMAIFVGGTIEPATVTDIENQLQQHDSSRIVLVINSQGGNVESGRKIMDLLKQKKKPIDCVVTGAAASMAFTLLTLCDTRYSLATSFFLVHDVRIQYRFAMMTWQEMELELADLKAVNKWQQDTVRASFGTYEQGQWFGSELARKNPKWIRVVDSITWIEKK
jgi:ATP-dependent protease ClpP protease subunit